MKKDGGEANWEMKKSEKYNALGYLDLTAYYALRNIKREEAEKRKKLSQPKRRKAAVQK